ncbi:MAG: YaaR family protein [Tuberibacillus sp.]
MAIKIDQDRGTIHERRSPMKMVEKTSTPFKSFVQSQRHEKEAEMFQALLAEVDEQGRRLAKSRTVRDLQLYKRLIKDFLQKAVSYGLELSQSQSWFDPDQPIQTIVKQIDERLIDLTDEVLKAGSEPIRILSALDEIKGLLINLYR